MSDAAGERTRPRATPSPLASGLFRRIFLTFVLTVVASAAVTSVGAYLFASRFSADWVGDTAETIERYEPTLLAQLDHREDLERTVEGLAAELKADVAIYQRPGGLIAGHGPKRPPPSIRNRRRELRTGQFVVLRDRPVATPAVAVALDHGHGRHPDTILIARPRHRLWAVPLISVFLLIAVLGVGAWVLTRSLAGRLQSLRTSADRIAKGDLAHRMETAAPKPVDEIDDVALAFNHMAEQVEVLVTGQKTLLANVSHELRTPIARVKVLLEILEARTEALTEGRGKSEEHVQRLTKGVAEMHDDMEEIEGLIRDLLTSGRLDLKKGGGEAALQRQVLDAHELLDKIAGKVGAEVKIHGVERLNIDEMLMGRLLSNLLANARRACPDGTITLECIDRGDAITIAVEDEGTGVPVADRSAIFEPFTRLDAARDRDRGGVGLGLYLSRQIARAHGGTIEVSDRADGARGARFVLTLPPETSV